MSLSFVAFQVGRSNVGRKGRRVTSGQSLERWNETLTQGGLRFSASYGHTGNFIVESRALVTVDQAITALAVLQPLRFCVFSRDDFKQWLDHLSVEMSAPSVQKGRRATLGAVMDLNPRGETPPMLNSSQARVFSDFGVPRVRAVWKLDLVKEGKRETVVRDERRREGGWGAVAHAMKIAVGGEWTARSMKTLEGLGKQLSARATTP